MEPAKEITIDDHKKANQIKMNHKGGRPKADHNRSTKKVTLYLTEEEHALLTEFAKTAWHMFNYSGAARYLLLDGLKGWMRKGKKSIK